jgi:hypothetical protein
MRYWPASLCLFLLPDCARQPEPLPAVHLVTKTVVKYVDRDKPGPVVHVCPTDAEIATGVVLAYRNIYPNIPGREGTCACPYSTFTTSYGKQLRAMTPLRARSTPRIGAGPSVTLSESPPTSSRTSNLTSLLAHLSRNDDGRDRP